MIFRGSWGYVVTFWCRSVPETFLDAPWLGAGWLAGGLGGPGGAQDGSDPPEGPPRSAGEARGGRARKLKDFTSWDFRALKL